MPAKVHCVLLSDVIDSRKIQDRKKFEKLMAKALKQLNALQAEALVMPAKAWKGLDEVAAMIREPWMAYGIMDLLNNAIAPEQMRFVLVKGIVDIKPASGDITQADGAAFHEAATLMMQLKAEGLWFDCNTGSESFDAAWKTGVNLLRVIKQRWTKQQLATYVCYKQTGSQEAVAKKMKISQQAVSKTLKAISAFQVSRLENSLVAWAQMNKQ